ncbi:DUF6683 family protein [Inquilinus sp.]|jgi:hypothetical protein|uniref:DUF6683 family protein n=1 Tax=Inquilinus sp. TaxID=1932117 RepID=UPI0037852405
MRRFLRFLLCALGAIAIWPAAAPAQDGWGWSIIIPSVTGTDTLGQALRQGMQEQQRAQPGVAAPAPAGFRYTPSHERRAANQARFVARSRAADPQGADNLAKVFAATDIIEQMRAPLAAVGLRIDDVADAYAVWWINAWQASRGVDDDVSRATALAVRDQAARAMAASGMLSGAGDAAKQEMAESFLIQAALVADALKQSQGNPELGRQVAAAVSQGARGMNVDLASMTLTETGFVPAE